MVDCSDHDWRPVDSVVFGPENIMVIEWCGRCGSYRKVQPDFVDEERLS